MQTSPSSCCQFSIGVIITQTKDPLIHNKNPPDPDLDNCSPIKSSPDTVNLLIPPSLTIIPTLEDINLSKQPQCKTLKYRNTDIEINIPVSKITFAGEVLQPELLHVDNTPNGSLASPFFPDPSHSSDASPQRSPGNRLEAGYVDSPISVQGIPHESGLFIDFSKVEEESGGKIKEFKQELIYCEICQRKIKKRSYKAHLRTKIHQSNLNYSK
ncbi:hypothetical protein SteCoe_7868 [Stentor coeruleus]|uniref:U1-type domain-containing protein n=1 Tax=Stentor coeruleus TaxID=5963 RepID=A0A1R2CLL6_9CILI|nr:hypothetical protein SteCoe_7868 [Stentor coeruleus]